MTMQEWGQLLAASGGVTLMVLGAVIAWVAWRQQ